MAYTPLMLLISCILFLLQLRSITADPIGYACSGPSGVTYTTNNNKYLPNLNLLLLSLSAHANATSVNGFYNTTVGVGSDKVYGLYLCRGDLTHQDCQDCVKAIGEEIKQQCPKVITAISWYDECLIRYSNQSIFSISQQEPVIYPYGPKDITNLDEYNKTVGDLMYGLVKKAAFGSTIPKYYAAGEARYYTSYDNVYGLVQCTPDITPNQCNRCLVGSITDIPRLLYPKQGGRVLKPSCNLRYEFDSPFYDQVPSPPSTKS